MRLRPATAVSLSLTLGLLALSGRALAGPVTPNPLSVTFPDTGVGAQSPQQMVVFTNTSNASVNITDISMQTGNPGDFVIDNMGFPPPLTLGPGVALPVAVLFKPIAGGVRQSILRATLTQNGQAAGTADVTCKGNGLGPKIAVTPSPIDMGGTRINVTLMKQITVSNSGGGVVKVTSMSLSGPNAASYSIAGAPGLPTSLGANQSFMMQLTFTPLSQGVHTATLNVVSDDPNTPNLAVAITGRAGDPTITTDVGTVAFGLVKQGATSPLNPITVSNTGNSDLKISMVTVDGANPGDFMVDPAMLPMTLPVNAKGTITAACKPTKLGNLSARIVISSNDPNTPNKFIGMLCTGSFANLMADKNKLDFTTQRIYGASMAQTITVSNSGNDFANITSLDFSGPQKDWFRTNPALMLPLKVTSMGNQKIDVTAVPLGLGAGSATLTIKTDDPMNPMFVIPVSVTGIGASVMVDPPFGDFGGVGVLGKVTKTYTVTNIGTDTLTIVDFQLVGMNADQFTIPNAPTPPKDLKAGEKFTFDVVFSPQAEGMYVAEIDMETTDPMARFIHIPLDGTGAVASISVMPNMLNFNTVQVGQTSTPQTVTITNNGGAPLTIQSVSLTGANANQWTFEDPMPPFVLDGMKARTIQVVYRPVLPGAHTASLVVTPQGFAPATVKLSGTGVTASVSVAIAGQAPGATTFDFGDITVGTASDPISVGVKNTGMIAVQIKSIGSTDGQFAVDTATPKTTLMLAPGAQTTFQVVLTPASAGTKMSTITLNLQGMMSASATLKMTGNGIQKTAPLPRTGGCSVARRAGSGAAALLLVAPLALVALRRRRRSPEA